MSNLVVLFHRPESQEWFEKTLEIISKSHYFVSLDEIVEYYKKNKKLRNACHITFDDGEQSVFEIAYPILKRKGIPATLFVSPKIINSGTNYWFQQVNLLSQGELRTAFKEIVNQDQRLDAFKLNPLFKSQKIERIMEVINKANHANQECQNMTVENLKELSNSGLFEIGAHTLNHPILANENDLNSEQEIFESIRDLKLMLDKPIRSFAYPNGLPVLDYTNREIRTLEKSDVEIAFSCRYGYMRKSDNIYEVPRLEIESGSSRKIAMKAKYLADILNIYVKMKKNSPYKQRELINKIIN